MLSVGSSQNRKDLKREKFLEGRGVGLCWAHSQPKGPKGPPVSAYVGSSKNLKDLKDSHARLRPLCHRWEPCALEGWILEILCCDPKGSRAFLRVLATEGRGVGLCWEKSKPKGPKGPKGLGEARRLPTRGHVHPTRTTCTGVPRS